jgi:hypothetical protein
MPCDRPAATVQAHPWLSPAALAVLVLAGPVGGRWLLGRPRWAWTLFGVSLLPIVLLTLLPVSRTVFERCAVSWQLPTPDRVELMANVVLSALLAWVAIRLARRDRRRGGTGPAPRTRDAGPRPSHPGALRARGPRDL